MCHVGSHGTKRSLHRLASTWLPRSSLSLACLLNEALSHTRSASARGGEEAHVPVEVRPMSGRAPKASATRGDSGSAGDAVLRDDGDGPSGRRLSGIEGGGGGGGVALAVDEGETASSDAVQRAWGGGGGVREVGGRRLRGALERLGRRTVHAARSLEVVEQPSEPARELGNRVGQQAAVGRLLAHHNGALHGGQPRRRLRARPRVRARAARGSGAAEAGRRSPGGGSREQAGRSG